MRLLGISGTLGLDIFGLAGVPVDRDDPPWWCVACLEWLARVKSIYDGTDDAAKSAQVKLAMALGHASNSRHPGYGRGPAAVYAIYSDLVNRRTAAREGRQ